jgi:DHA1 family tetracycline resistance protein-like MFS transporter
MDKNFWTLIVIVFLNMLGIGILIPVIPALIIQTDSQYYMLGFEQSKNAYIILGLLMASYPFMQFFAAPILGDLSDRYGRKPVLFFSLLGTTIGYIIFIVGLLTRSLPILFISRIIDGITGGNTSVAQAAISDQTMPEDRARRFGMIGAAFGLGFILGPFLGGVLGKYSSVYPFILATILSLIATILVWLILPETNTNKTGNGNKIELTKSIRDVISAFKHPTLSKLFSTTLFLSAGFTFFTTFFGAFLINRFGFNENKIGIYFAFIGIWIVITLGFLSKYVSKKFETKKIIVNSLFIFALTLTSYFFIHNVLLIYILVPIFSISISLIQANLTAYISENTNKEKQGEVLGINSSMQSASGAVIPIIAGLIGGAFGSAALPIIIGAICVFIAFFIFRKFMHKK